MLVFLKWSGLRGKAVSGAMRDWLGDVMPASEPWFAGEIEQGRWTDKLTHVLEGAGVGIVCLTRDNRHDLWIRDEVRTLTKSSNIIVYTLLIGAHSAAGEQPLPPAQRALATKDDLLWLLRNLNRRAKQLGEKGLDAEQLTHNFERRWPTLKKQLQEIDALSLSDFPPDTPQTVSALAHNKRPSRRGRRIQDVGELEGLWLKVLLRMRQKIGVAAVTYLYDARLIELTKSEAVLEFRKAFHYQKACEAAQRLPFEQILNECLVRPRILKFRLAENPLP